MAPSQPTIGSIPKTTAKTRVSRSPSRSSRSSSSSSSRSRTPPKRSDAYHAGGRRKHLDLAKTYRNSSSEGSHSKGLHLRPQKKKKRRRQRSYSSSRSRS